MTAKMTLISRGRHQLSVLGTTLSVMRNPLQFLAGMATQADAVPLEFAGGWRMLLLNHPQDVEQVLVQDRRFPKRHPFLAEMKRFIGEGLATSEGELWRSQRRIVQQAFNREHVSAYADDMAGCTARLLGRYRDGEVRDLYADFMRLSIEGTSRALFSTEGGANSEELIAAVSVVMQRFNSPLFMFAPLLDRLPLPSVRRVEHARQRIEALVGALISNRRHGPRLAKADLLSTLMAERGQEGSPMSDRQLRDEVTTLYIAGYEPLAVALGWTVHLLLQHPAELKKVSEQARSVLGTREATKEDVANLPAVRQAIEESLRLYPPAWTIVREASEPCEFRGHAVPKGGLLWFSPFVLHRDPRYFAEPNQFRPDRWESGFAKTLPRGAYLPYGAGPRMCVGAPLAAAEMPRILAMLLSRFDLKPVAGPVPKPYPSINLRPSGGVWAELRAR
jgi:cytochrome P450